MTGTPNKILLTYILWFVSHHPEAKEEYAKLFAQDHVSDGPLRWANKNHKVHDFQITCCSRYSLSEAFVCIRAVANRETPGGSRIGFSVHHQ
jgi:hypothetical protein